ncbi:MAG: hypothetical protein AAF919_09360 [Pseudomonadota bacterium]
MKSFLLLPVAALTALVLFYLSQFWFLDLWPREGLFGFEALHPRGDLLARWLRGTQFAPFDLLIWACGSFLVLTGLQSLVDFLTPTPPEDHNDD